MVSLQRKIGILLVVIVSCGMASVAEPTVVIRRKTERRPTPVVHVVQRPQRPSVEFVHRPSYVIRPIKASILLGTAVAAYVALVLIYWLSRDSHEETHHYVHHNAHSNDHVVVVHDHHQPDVIVVDDGDEVVIVDDGNDDIIIVD